MAAPNNKAPGKVRVVFLLVPFALGFLILATVIHLLLPDPLRLHADMRSEKLEMLDGWRGGIYAASFGSSHVNDGFDPRAFDDELSDMQRSTPSINLGLEGGSHSEQRAMALAFLRHFPTGSIAGQQPCFILLELNAGANLTVDHLLNPRAINIYDWNTTRFVFSLSDNSFSRLQRYGRDAYALAAMGLHYANVGMLSNYILKPPFNQETLKNNTQDGRRGLHGLKGEDYSLTPEFEALMASRPPVPVQQRLIPGNYRLLEELAAASNHKNLHFIYFVTPLHGDVTRYPLYPSTIQTPYGVEPILSLARADIYPELFAPNYWHDDAHLNESGAALASRLLADQLKTWYLANHRMTNCGG